MNPKETLQNLSKAGKGILRTAEAEKAGISRMMLSSLVRNGTLERIAFGQYVLSGELPDDLFALQQRTQKLIYSHDTALFLHDLTDRTPFMFTATVPSSYKVSKAIRERSRIFYIKPELHDLGATLIDSKMGHAVKSYDVERTICDVLRSRKRLDEQIVLDAIKRYAASKSKNLNKLHIYAEKLRIVGVVRRYLEVLL
ncbi:MAG: type IV toxin-antitoxin system AbiEi family antitoxin domain-containing protein [Actinomycetota bacterium]|nr:type IV toxin-antitoxin system AbiEi family antitoxin domain-containing protein [Actinomycetota bacterium]